MPDTRELPVFPLGSVLLPGMPLPLQVFEPRYVALLQAVLATPERAFGTVLIERGSEVGGGDVRFGVGTVAQVLQVEVGDEVIVLVARGTTRFEVVRWLAEEPYPRALVRDLPPLAVDEADAARLAGAERTVREVLARASEFVDVPWPADVELSEDPAVRLWQVAGIAPVGPLDRLALLRSASAGELLERLVAESLAAGDAFASGWTDDDGVGPV
ncbi:LON peptidase substrate-binding domain-containing protein [Cellulomonas endophytica]|uniref:LON peptidase substrate-binding domain-containing protein n=1 Tax=Cellulomonas endophytica TaxID=2494735 RepID=UPI001F0C49DB|nr:LON peptidase substrate-binding domain-containing protein [Cellulomonas endophytica]